MTAWRFPARSRSATISPTAPQAYSSPSQVAVENGKKVEITTTPSGDDNRYINSMSLNGKKYDANYLKHADLVKGAKINYNMADKPNKTRGVAETSAPYSFSNEK